jgi:hypothetical protein
MPQESLASPDCGKTGHSVGHRLRKKYATPCTLIMPITFNTVRKIALALDDVEEGSSYGTPAFKLAGVLFLRLRPELDSLVVRASFNERKALIAEDPETYYITDHYLNYEWVLVRLSAVRLDALKDLIEQAWKSAASHKRNCKRRSKSQHSKE